MKKHILAAVCLSLGLAGHAQAETIERWSYLVTDAGGGQFFYDLFTTKFGNRIRQAWIKNTGATCSTYNPARTCETKALWVFDCLGKTAGQTKTFTYDPTTNVTYVNWEGKAVMTEPIPDSVAEAIIFNICSIKAGK